MSTLLITFSNIDTDENGHKLTLTKRFNDKTVVLIEILRLIRLTNGHAVESSGPQALTAIKLSHEGYAASLNGLYNVEFETQGCWQGDTVVNTVEFDGDAGGNGIYLRIEHLQADGWVGRSRAVDSFECSVDDDNAFSEAVEYMKDQIAAERFVQAERIREGQSC